MKEIELSLDLHLNFLFYRRTSNKSFGHVEEDKYENTPYKERANRIARMQFEVINYSVSWAETEVFRPKPNNPSRMREMVDS